MKIYLVRHGQTYLNKYDRMQGWADTPLTEKGRESAEKCGVFLSKKNINYVISSDLGRTIETSNIIKKYLSDNLELMMMAEFRETFFGSFEGEKNQNVWSAIAKANGYETINDFYHNLEISEIMDAFHKADPSNDAEDYSTFISRINKGLDKVTNTFELDANILLVTHGNTIRNIAYLIDSNLNCAEDVLNSGITTIEFSNDEMTLLSYNKAINE